MQILLVNDDGIHAPSLHALHAELVRWGDVTVVSPATEQSGVGHSITFLQPLFAHKDYRNGEFFGWKVEGRPADCVKLGIQELCPKKPDLIVSGLNAGANVGLNVLYSGTIGAAMEGAFYGIPSIALSQWMDGPADFEATSRRAIPLCKRLLERTRPGMFWNVNFPAAHEGWPRGIRFVSVETRRTDEGIDKRVDPRGRDYFWSGLNPMKSHMLETGMDVKELMDGHITITPLHFDLTAKGLIHSLQEEEWSLS